jgi:alkylation response protein AidB-like acyl-CoA dehydrogenase
LDLELTDDQRLFQETTRKFLEAETPLTTVRQLEHDPAGFDRGWWAQGAALGWTALLVPEDHGGGSVSGAGVRDLVIVAEEMGRAVAPGPFLPTNLVALALVRSGGAAHQSDVLPGIVAGEVVAAWAYDEPGARWDAGRIQLAAAERDGGFVLDGRKTKVEAAAAADQLLVTARSPDGLTQLLVARDTPGVTVVPLEGLDLVRRFADVRFEGVEVPAEAVVGTVGGADDDVARQLQLALVLQCAAMSGATSRVFDFTVEYAFDRFSFGRPLASYQALKHRFADMKLWVEACFATTDGAARAIQDDDPKAGRLASVAKAYVGERTPEIIQDCVQLHGGIGVTWEHDIHLFLRRVTTDRALYGLPDDHVERVASSLLDTAASPGGPGAAPASSSVSEGRP